MRTSNISLQSNRLCVWRWCFRSLLISKICWSLPSNCH